MHFTKSSFLFYFQFSIEISMLIFVIQFQNFLFEMEQVNAYNRIIIVLKRLRASIGYFNIFLVNIRFKSNVRKFNVLKIVFVCSCVCVCLCFLLHSLRYRSVHKRRNVHTYTFTYTHSRNSQLPRRRRRKLKSMCISDTFAAI